MPSVSATATAAAAIFSTFRVALGPRVEAARIPQSSSTVRVGCSSCAGSAIALLGQRS